MFNLVVLAIIQEKVNNPSPDDPFEPEIAAVSLTLPNWTCLNAMHDEQQMKEDKTRFLSTAKEWTKKWVVCIFCSQSVTDFISSGTQVHEEMFAVLYHNPFSCILYIIKSFGRCISCIDRQSLDLLV